ncbi:hypothetical protein NPIL_9101 [Nephila pilipes]|uniref:Uncharacterized protein n=1 Tax=Nephila pilipes TaxID=299642 RepID=A0A8X6UCK5_NEPPI|nr:hypothetical protein NPIL_9101 [Nephila pilipes]
MVRCDGGIQLSIHTLSMPVDSLCGMHLRSESCSQCLSNYFKPDQLHEDHYTHVSELMAAVIGARLLVHEAIPETSLHEDLLIRRFFHKAPMDNSSRTVVGIRCQQNK